MFNPYAIIFCGDGICLAFKQAVMNNIMLNSYQQFYLISTPKYF